MISYMREGNFIDSLTKSIVVERYVQSSDFKIHKHARAFHSFEGWKRGDSSDTQALAVGIYDEFSGSILLAMEVIVLCCVIYSTYALLSRIL